MPAYYETTIRKFVAAPGVLDPVTAFDFTRASSGTFAVQFLRDGVVIELGDGSETGQFVLKPDGQYDAAAVVAAFSWVKTGNGTSTVYTFSPDFTGNAGLDALLQVDGNAANDEDVVALMGAIKYVVAGVPDETRKFTANVHNNIVRGSETAPVTTTAALPVFLPTITSLAGAATFADGVTNSTTTLTSATAAFVAGDFGKSIIGAGIPAGTTIAAVPNATTVVLSAAATATASGVSFTIYRLSTALDAVATASLPIGKLISFAIAGVLEYWQLQTGTAVTDTAVGIVRPFDYAASSNTKNWIRAGSSASTFATNFTADQTIVAAPADTGTITQLFSWVANRIKAITGKPDWKTSPATTLEAAATHAASTANPHGVTKAQVALGNVDNTSDATKPISTATQTALDACLKLQTTSELSITGAATLTSAAVGKMHVCSGTTADYTIALPSAVGNAGKLIGFRMATGLTKLVTLDAGAGVTIDGSQMRIMWAHEAAVLMSDGAHWIKIAGKGRPMRACLRRSTAQSITNGAWTSIVCPTLVADNTPFGFADTVNGRVSIKRAGAYQASGFVSLGGVAASVEVNGGVGKSALPDDSPNAFTSVAAPNSGFVHIAGSGAFACAAGDWLAPLIFHADTVARNTRAVGTVYPTISVAEVLDW